MDSVVKEKSDIQDDHINSTVSSGVANILIRCLFTVLWLPLSIACLPLFLVGLYIWGLPPIISPWSRYFKYCVAAFTEGSSKENIPFTNRILVFLIIISALVKTPVSGTCWFMDELLFSGYRRIEIKEPVFYITGTRSGSTQLCGYLENDTENFIVPMSGEGLFPFIWVWKFIVPVLRVLGMAKHVDAQTDVLFGAEAKKRHNFNLLSAESFEIVAGAWHHTYLAWYLGYSFMKWGFPFSAIEEPVDEQFCKSLLDFINLMMKKVMYSRGKSSQRMLMKGHFLKLASALEHHYPNAKFFTVVRKPQERFHSFINFMMTISTDGPPSKDYALMPVSWQVLRNYVIYTQTAFCKQEMSFYEQSKDKKLVIPFSTYVSNLNDTLQSIYSFCNLSIPTDVLSNIAIMQGTVHNRQKRRESYNPLLNRSLDSLGVVEEKLNESLAEYNQWIMQLEESKNSQ